MNQPPTLQVTDVARAQILASQAEWLEHPVTHMVINALSQRKFEYKHRLIERCMRQTDEKQDIQDRACMSTCDAILKIMTDPELFVKYSTAKVQ